MYDNFSISANSHLDNAPSGLHLIRHDYRRATFPSRGRLGGLRRKTIIYL